MVDRLLGVVKSMGGVSAAQPGHRHPAVRARDRLPALLHSTGAMVAANQAAPSPVSASSLPAHAHGQPTSQQASRAAPGLDRGSTQPSAGAVWTWTSPGRYPPGASAGAQGGPAGCARAAWGSAPSAWPTCFPRVGPGQCSGSLRLQRGSRYKRIMIIVQASGRQMARLDLCPKASCKGSSGRRARASSCKNRLDQTRLAAGSGSRRRAWGRAGNQQAGRHAARRRQ